MLFLLRPQQTYLPYALPRNRMEQAEYDRQLQESYNSTRRVTPYEPDPTQPVGAPDLIADLKELGDLHRSGALSDEEFVAAKSKLLQQTNAT
jgi:hypothetical protein